MSIWNRRGQAATKRPFHWYQRRLRVEALENRWLLAAAEWLGGAGDWSDDAKWSPAQEPGATDTAYFKQVSSQPSLTENPPGAPPGPEGHVLAMDVRGAGNSSTPVYQTTVNLDSYTLQVDTDINVWSQVYVPGVPGATGISPPAELRFTGDTGGKVTVGGSIILGKKGMQRDNDKWARLLLDDADIAVEVALDVNVGEYHRGELVVNSGRLESRWVTLGGTGNSTATVSNGAAPPCASQYQDDP